MALLCYNGTKECDGCQWCYDHDTYYESKNDDVDLLYDISRDKSLYSDDIEPYNSYKD